MTGVRQTTPTDASTAEATQPGTAAGQVGHDRFAPYLMNRIMGRYNATLRQTVAEAGLTTAQIRTLGTLAARGGLSINELAVYTVIELSTLSRTLDRMEEDGLVRRVIDEADSRVRRISLTPKGDRTFEAIRPIISAAEAALFAGIADSEKEQFIDTLVKMLSNIRQHPL